MFVKCKPTVSERVEEVTQYMKKGFGTFEEIFT